MCLPQAECLWILQELPNSLGLWQTQVTAGVWCAGVRHAQPKQETTRVSSTMAEVQKENALLKSTESGRTFFVSQQSTNRSADDSPGKPWQCKARSLEASIEVDE